MYHFFISVIINNIYKKMINNIKKIFYAYIISKSKVHNNIMYTFIAYNQSTQKIPITINS